MSIGGFTFAVTEVHQTGPKSLESVKRRHDAYHRSLDGAMLAFPAPPCDVCWLIAQLEAQ